MADNTHPLPEPHDSVTPFATAPQPLTVEYTRRKMVMYHVAEGELDALVEGGSSMNLLFFGVCFGAFASFVSVLLSTDIQGPKTFATFVALTVLFFIGSLVFGINGWRDYREAKEKLSNIKAC